MTSTIVGVSRAEQLRDSLAATEVPLDVDLRRALDRITERHRGGPAI